MYFKILWGRSVKRLNRLRRGSCKRLLFQIRFYMYAVISASGTA
ncbi:hypothetical protein OESDEN_21862 [Oesophagostomum dentatum]|uniref:Uncharacterized protein n=1 Tax=Oesophagostomum dentatum TaxID=61180 RepID=A0A0B1S3Q1_OESDE|nr:hypothetical protein OESDEN_21862 [Oesophagostomum dentatum]